MKLRKRTRLYVEDNSTYDGKFRRKKPFTLLRRSATEIMNYRIWRKILIAGIVLAVVVLLIGYAFVLFYDRTGRFSVAVYDPDDTFAISLSEEPSFKFQSSRLINDQYVKVDNICGNSLPANINEIDGEHNGENYLAYTFYCKNVGSAPCSLNYEITFNNVTNHLDECVRVRVYVDGAFTDYAKTRSDGAGPETHFCDKAFANKYTVCYGSVDKLEIGFYSKFTVVIWLEGDDDDCNDSVLYGMMKFDMSIAAKAAAD